MMAEKSDKLLGHLVPPPVDPVLSDMVNFGRYLMQETPVNGFQGDPMDTAQDMERSNEQAREEAGMDDDDKRAWRDEDTGEMH